MSMPYCFIKGATYHVSQRCFDRKLKINPSKSVNNAILFSLCYALHKYDIEIHAFCFMSNHFHLILTDNEARLGDFMSVLNSLISRFLKVACGMKGPVWDPRPYSRQVLVDEESIINMIVYTITNPVTATLVPNPEDWPGLISTPKDLCTKNLKAIRPKQYFSPHGVTPEKINFQLSIPPKLKKKFSIAEFKSLIEKKVKNQITEIKTLVRKSKSSFLGKNKILRQSRNKKPKSPPRKSNINPKIVCKDSKLRVRVLKMLKQFQIEYREAFLLFRSGDKSAKFPQGTFKLRRDANVKCKSKPTVLI